MLSDLYIRFRSLFRKSKVEGELDEELRFHLERHIEKSLRAGMTRQEASRRARLEFGGLDQVKEQCRDARGVTFLTTLGQDLRYSVRILRRSPGFTAVVVLILALGIGANVAVFSILDAVLLRPLPYRNADRLVMVVQHMPKEEAPAFDTYREFEEWKRSSRSFDQLAAATWARNSGAVLSLKGKKQQIMTVPVSVDFFSLLGVPAALGRTFAADDIKNPCTVVLSHQFWRQRLDSAPQWVGKSLTLDGIECTIAGVMPRDFSFYPRQTELWTLIPTNSNFQKNAWDMPVLAFGLLKLGVSRPAVDAELAAIQSRIISESPAFAAMKLQPGVLDLQAELTWLTGRNLRRGLLLLFAVVGFVLLIACVNVANLMLGRAAERQKELTVRAAIGASRARLIRQLLTESAVLSIGGAGVGIPLAIVSLRYIAIKQAEQLPPGNPLTIHWEVLTFAFLLAVLTSILFGLAPAWKASRIDLNESLKQSSPGASRAASHKISRSLVVVEMALSLIVLVAAGLLIESLFRLTNADRGYQRTNLYTADIRLPASAYPKPEDKARFWDQVESRVRSIPGVTGAALGVTLSGTSGSDSVSIEGTGSAPQIGAASGPEPVSVGYFHVLGIPLLQGRDFTENDRAESPAVAIVNQAFVQRFFPSGSAIGRRIKFGAPAGKGPWMTIVGVVGNVSRPTLFTGYSQLAYAYHPLKQDSQGNLALYVRTAGKIPGVPSEVASAITAIDGNLPTPELKTVDESLAWFLAVPQFRAQLFGLFAALALVLAAIGIYGVLAQLVVQRTHEIGIRVALGADHHDILRLILSEGLKLILAGVLIGVVGALVLSRLLSSMLYRVGTADPLAFASVSLLLVGVAILACYIPARRAMRMNPLAALRCE